MCVVPFEIVSTGQHPQSVVEQDLEERGPGRDNLHDLIEGVPVAPPSLTVPDRHGVEPSERRVELADIHRASVASGSTRFRGTNDGVGGDVGGWP